MSNVCCVLDCVSYLDTVRKPHLFSFPADCKLKLKWIKAIERKDLVVTKNTKVCEKHFVEDDIEYVTKCYQDQTGEKLIATVKLPRLKDGAVPSIFPTCNSGSISPKDEFILSDNEQNLPRHKKAKLSENTDPETESQNIFEPSIVIKEEPMDPADETSPMIDSICSMDESMPSTSCSSNTNLPAFSTTSVEKESAAGSIPVTKNTQNPTGEIFLSLGMDGSENNTSSASGTRENPSDLFNVFANFVAAKLRGMDFDNSAYVLRSILDIVYKAGQDQQSSGDEDNDEYVPGATSSSSSDHE